ncbi:MAG: bifunctional 5,10-methylenetetrahydrofolate dehydrogenase/5,10-methenyltetrahydrofolate cyclohydrolase [Bacteriovoracaceae bacterium]|jgi:methylenetetrahydrofolate dehydrogenase (NADP+)/methenyltetrahydrofolate cyclohydrolase|nr:bifunctional 5,10-methylenetetrahydrofolate dehydrogenase/5,10-methenyltetrahydrofolate cyclohydrolase [Bacteriovoracaceae bacterium]
MERLLRAKTLIDDKILYLKQKSQALSKQGLKPHLGVILVGNNPASLSYIKNKEKFCSRIEADFSLINLPEDIEKEKFLEHIQRLNEDHSVTGCFVQLPLPNHFNDLDVTQMINPLKDVDGFHLKTIEKIYQGDLTGIIPCTPKGIITLLEANNIQIKGMDIVIIGRSYIVGKPLSLLLERKNATVTLCHSHTKDIKKYTSQADIIISAVGIPLLITKEHLNPQNNQIIIDVGINRYNNKLVGDVDFESVKDHVKAITPVPGGVGPMTVFSLMENLILTTTNILNNQNKGSL